MKKIKTLIIVFVSIVSIVSIGSFIMRKIIINDDKVSLNDLPISQEFNENKVTIESVKFYEEYLVTHYFIENMYGNNVDIKNIGLIADDVKNLIIYGLDGQTIDKKISNNKYEVWQITSVFGTENTENFIDLKYKFIDEDSFSKPYKFSGKIRAVKTKDSEVELNKIININGFKFNFKTLTKFDFGSILDFTIESKSANISLPEYAIEVNIDGNQEEVPLRVGRSFSNKTEKTTYQLEDLKKLRGDISTDIEKINFSKVTIAKNLKQNFTIFLVDIKTGNKFEIYSSE